MCMLLVLFPQGTMIDTSQLCSFRVPGPHSPTLRGLHFLNQSWICVLPKCLQESQPYNYVILVVLEIITLKHLLFAL
jgi:hypothetical protein